jgi:hypothetical protein
MSLVRMPAVPPGPRAGLRRPSSINQLDPPRRSAPGGRRRGERAAPGPPPTTGTKPEVWVATDIRLHARHLLPRRSYSAASSRVSRHKRLKVHILYIPELRADQAADFALQNWAHRGRPGNLSRAFTQQRVHSHAGPVHTPHAGLTLQSVDDMERFLLDTY